MAPLGSFEQASGLAEAVCARLCHDLAGPLGALTGTLELALAGDEEAAGLAMELAALLSARLSLLRSAWGGGEADAHLGPAALQAGLPGGDRLRVEVAGLDQAAAEPVRPLAAPLLLVAAAGLPRGGTISLSWSAGSGPHEAPGLALAIAGTSAAWPQTLAACASSPDLCLPAPGGPRGVAIPLACLLAHRLGLTLKIDSPTTLSVAASGVSASFTSQAHSASHRPADVPLPP